MLVVHGARTFSCLLLMEVALSEYNLNAGIEGMQAPEAFEDVAVCFTDEEWKMLNKQEKELHKEVMMQNYETMISVGYNIQLEHLLLLIKKDEDAPAYEDQKDTSKHRSSHHEKNSSSYNIPIEHLESLSKSNEKPHSLEVKKEEHGHPIGYPEMPLSVCLKDEKDEQIVPCKIKGEEKECHKDHSEEPPSKPAVTTSDLYIAGALSQSPTPTSLLRLLSLFHVSIFNMKNLAAYFIQLKCMPAL
ncbi:zinc finger protein 2-like isoform X3 [Protopterus annectens]|uniref:zinc finger protein 2-like isoform X3 n=1 Tax=Protopterus annectens TaxID=7888 RepID=UPI001CFB174B|nr:zinc finger protein 2-like isoform X3 [Protopterus annectens]